MQKVFISSGLALFFVIHISCTGVKKMSGTLTRSDGGTTTTRDYSRGNTRDYSKEKVDMRDVKRDSAVTIVDVNGGNSITLKAAPEPSDHTTYRKDYSALAGGKTENTGVVATGSTDVNERLLRQYADMDRLANLVLYELDIVERQWDLQLSRFKTAPPADREKISRELDKLNADQLTLYRAHVRIYKEGKTDWPQTKKEVEATLRGIRGLTEK